MILGIMQPYFFPYLGYFELIARTDQWVVFDVVQYNAKSWMNRNRILHPKEGWQYITVPVAKAPRDTLIRDIRIRDIETVESRILGQLNHYKKRAPFFNEVISIVEKAFAGNSSNRLRDLNIMTLATTCDYLGIEFNWSICSQMDLDLEGISHPGQWALKIACQLGASEYINPPGGKDIFNSAEWEEAGILLEFTKLPELRYNCSPFKFVEHLSILDVMMWNAPDMISDFLKKSIQPIN